VSFISFDAPRRRPVPAHLAGEELRDGDVIVAVKNDCDGCETLLDSDLPSLTKRRVFFVARDALLGHDEVVVDPTFLDTADVKWPPFVIVVGGEPLEVVNECVPFGPQHLIETLGL